MFLQSKSSHHHRSKEVLIRNCEFVLCFYMHIEIVRELQKRKKKGNRLHDIKGEKR